MAERLGAGERFGREPAEQGRFARGRESLVVEGGGAVLTDLRQARNWASPNSARTSAFERPVRAP
ncbi:MULTISPECIES: hypothetical protein [unclassified Cryobacterium]|uniref:hypothetical protein n=1 Tax=unclassified Cryobacterium TaxID=2649013 RepID=UPI002AB54818|nr:MULTISPECIES: hypothetical protein [unclassified Cryobacterium]MDY7558078.1 hypothetical protein [Cryobacterium sp. 10C3]MEB0003419.1 hypothetical protein [Cryobacterium sp. RTC2.1]MEB0287802.1 hypothetical protein [Cryobacterium sp. 10S3]MEB0307088.1 hypothetical protein [Cryobacterium sp. 10I1]WPX13600.1 hypothetical protein RHM57_18370 [Cryobacterium sp. 10S3]